MALPTKAPSDNEVLGEEAPLAFDDNSMQLIKELRTTKTPELASVTVHTTIQPTVLVVEDNPDMNSFICSLLQPHYRVISASSGNDGLQTAIDSHPDLILSDIMMPGMSGDAMAEEVRNHAELENVPIIVLTAKADDDLQIKMLKSGITDYIRKPFLPDELLARISVVLAERLESRKKLHLSEERFRSIFNNSPIAIGIGDIQSGLLIEVNSAWLQLFGYERNEVIGQSTVGLGMYVKDNERDEIVRMIREHGRVVNQPTKLRRKTGDILEILYSAEIITLDAQPCLQVMMTDVTERMRIDEEIRNIKMLLEQSFEQSPVSKVLVTMPNAIIHSINPACQELLGIEDEPPVAGTSFFNFKPSFLDFDQSGNPGLLENLPLARAMRGEKTINEERHIVRKDGSERWALASGVPICDQNGTVIAGYLVMVDITTRKRAGSEVRRLTAILNESQHIAQVGGWEIDLTNNSLYWTNETFRIHDTFPDEYTPTLESALAFYHPESLPIITAAVKMAIEENNNFNLELKMITAKGRPILVHTTCKVIRENDKPVKIMGAFRDITGQKLLEGHLHQAQKMESVGSLAGGVAHDFNNKLSVILGYANLASIESDPVLIRQYLDEILKAGEQSADLTRQLLAFARKQTISPKVLDLNETVSGMLKMLNRLIGEDIHLIWQPAPDLWLLKFDPSQIDQILANLCVNARDSISSDGKITIVTANILIDDDYCSHHADALPGEFVRLVVSDNGCGMDKETMDRIFEPFFTTKETGKGTGLGLSTVFGIVKQNNGFIRVYSEGGIGTTFTIYLPRYEGTSARTVKEGTEIPAPVGIETILLVEDELAILNMASMILSKLGYTVLSANSPAEANRLAKAHAGEISLLITDVIMPDVNGKDLAHGLQLLFPKLKCLFMSGYTADAISQHGVLDDGVNFIQKPFSLADLATKVRGVLDGK